MCLVLLIMHGVTHAEHLLKVLKLFSGNKNYRIGSQKNVAIDFCLKYLNQRTLQIFFSARNFIRVI